MKYLKYNELNQDFVKKNMMGPNSMIMLEYLLQGIKLKKGMKVLDLGCGTGLTSIYLVKEYGVQVYAMDLWVTEEENRNRFKEIGMENDIIPIHADASKELPFKEEFFDAVISVDSYHYFGFDEHYFDTKLGPYIKENALIAIGVPGMKKEIHNNVPDEMKEYWPKDTLKTWQTCEAWEKLLSKSKLLYIDKIAELDCFNDAWSSWLATKNSYAIRDKKMIAADDGRFMNLVGIIGHRRKAR